ncbi:transposase IS3/IS911 family protein [Cupriavidus sp. HMR-1]|uniref:IS66-like element accessory protein TnpA n=1 Tax=Cupriavidus sp. HMR-1 TaxID=1249621 RepID=UPI0002A2CF11|nr:MULTISPECIES: transposase [Burkholderiales]EKZ96660.1 transposase IS3/IS911 family protein [Cupriavidus sp. HMR-1]
MNPNRSHRSNRRNHSPEFKAQVLGECQHPGASVAAIAVAHGLNPNVVRKWLAGQNLKRMDAARPGAAPSVPPLQFVAVELAKPEHHRANPPASQPDIRIELQRSGLQLKLRCAAADGPAHAALLRALADTVAAP